MGKDHRSLLSGSDIPSEHFDLTSLTAKCQATIKRERHNIPHAVK